MGGLAQVGDSNLFVWHNVNYTKIQAVPTLNAMEGQSQYSSMFGQVNLGPHERIRKMLWTRNAGKQDYPVIMFLSNDQIMVLTHL